MKIFLVLAVVVAVALAAPQGFAEKPTPIPIVQYDEQRDDHGQYSLSYTSGDGTIMTRQGALEPTADGKDYVLIESGSSRHISPEGQEIKLVWTAGKEGFHPMGEHLPVAPAGPEIPAPKNPDLA